ncbi:helix-turn-helix transcriptional regulator [Parvibaculum sp.]|jgi:transcriptional regulator with XRE-family HTH domain|uniref:helix-turn-helix domain-containing protein n=1 Tax=Parvibaculum sp. TaxID=2024848 RepID=UPI001B21AEF5|nr:helix-turn-helix transcriptional regulator [Parvibaculum sp.]MBO6669651.1 helix-turn-helix transcriptional regulator [Parvibaculum sp.]MBO6692838.1 helix-turn-helix transcriptional regulator [Parvibaculum sp.]MBO6716051.1 helix-turn-helix transcriptional regulator [Parvibaculum sp.]
MAGSLKKHVGGRIRAARKDAGLTQDQLAGMIDKSVETISNLERGHTAPSLETLDHLARALAQPVEWFLSGLKSNKVGDTATTALLRTEIDLLLSGMNESELRKAADILRVIGRPGRE